LATKTDFTIIDFVADRRAETPSAAAELVIRSRQEVEEQAEGLQQRLVRAIRYRLLMGRQVLTELAQHGAFARMMDAIISASRSWTTCSTGWTGLSGRFWNGIGVGRISLGGGAAL